MSGDDPGRPQDAVRWPSVAVEDPDSVANHPARRVDDDLSREVPDEADVVIPEHDLHSNALGEYACEEIEDNRTQGRRDAHDRVLHVARDQEGRRSILLEDPQESCDEGVGRAFGRAAGAVAARPESEVQVGDEERASPLRLRAPQEERGLVKDRAQRGFHGVGRGLSAMTLRVGSANDLGPGSDRRHQPA